MIGILRVIELSKGIRKYMQIKGDIEKKGKTDRRIETLSR